MKNIIITILVFASFLKLDAAQVQIHAMKNAAGAHEFYQVWTWNGPDLEMIITRYALSEVQSKFPSIFDKTESGTVNTPDRVFLNYNADGTILSVNFQTVSSKITGGEFEGLIKPQPELSGKVHTEVLLVKGDIETKTGKDIDGGPIKPPAEPPIEPEP